MQASYKILINCYACSPNRGSEPGMGWNFIIHLAKYHSLYIITEKVKWEKEINNYIEEHIDNKENLHFYFISKKRNKLLRKIWPPSYYWYYKEWQKKAYHLALKLDKEVSFDIIHQLNMVGYREPGYLWKINKPFVWGPIGGMNITPWCMLPSMGVYGATFYFFRNMINLFQMNFGKRIDNCMKHTDTVITATKDNYDAVKKLWGVESVIMSEIGSFSKNGDIEIKKRQVDEPLKICWSGQHTPRKSLNLLIDSVSEIISNHEIELNVIGVGRQTKSWKTLARKRGVDNIIWYGWVERQKAIEIMKNCHIFCITSLSDLTSTVLLEALSYGLPVIALDHCGFSNVITEKCGIKIPIHSKKHVIQGLSEAMKKLYSDENLRLNLAKGALERSGNFSWVGKVNTLNTIYNRLVNYEK